MITKEELLARLKAEGIKIGGNPDRMLTHFISLGLIDKPVRFGLGKGKGSVSKFEEGDVERIKKIVAMKEEGLTYEEIKHKLMSFNDWLSLVRKVKKSSKSEEETVNSIKKIPTLSAREKGRLKMTIDLAEHLAEIVVDELLRSFQPPWVSSHDIDRETLIRDVYGSMEFCLDNVLYDFGLADEDYEGYLAGKKLWKFPASMKTKKSKGE